MFICLEDNVNSFKYYDIINKNFPNMRYFTLVAFYYNKRMLSHIVRDKQKKWLNDNGTNVLYWPASSSDLYFQ